MESGKFFLPKENEDAVEVSRTEVIPGVMEIRYSNGQVAFVRMSGAIPNHYVKIVEVKDGTA